MRIRRPVEEGSITVKRFTLNSLLGALIATFLEHDAAAQVPQRTTYSNYYRQQYELTHAPPKSAANYTINNYYYHNKNISPYLNLVRPSSSYVPRYQAFVQPELERRARLQQPANVGQRLPNPSAQPKYSQMPSSSAIPNYGGPAARPQYHNQWYGGLQNGP